VYLRRKHSGGCVLAYTNEGDRASDKEDYDENESGAGSHLLEEAVHGLAFLGTHVDLRFCVEGSRLR
jgi:hypothetical protein